MKRILIAILALLFGITQINSSVLTYAMWNSLVSMKEVNIDIGAWEWKGLTPLDNAPAGTIDLDPLIESNSLNVTLNKNDYFLFEGGLYKVTSETGYNMQWHGLPSGNSAGWAFISLTLEWIGAQQRYPDGAVVKVNNRFFQVVHQGNLNNPLTNHGPLNSGKPWREIVPMEDYMFPLIEGTSLRNYSTPYSEYVVAI